MQVDRTYRLELDRLNPAVVASNTRTREAPTPESLSLLSLQINSFIVVYTRAQRFEGDDNDGRNSRSCLRRVDGIGCTPLE